MARLSFTELDKSVVQAERSYPTSEVRCHSRDELPHLRGQGSGQEELPHARDKWWWPRGATQPLRLGADAEMSYLMPEVRGCGPEEHPHIQVRQLHGCRRADRPPLLMFKARRGGSEEIPLVQGKEQWLHFAGAVVRRYPTSKVRETQVRQ